VTGIRDVARRARRPTGLKGAKELKPASRDIGTRLFPMLAEEILRQGGGRGRSAYRRVGAAQSVMTIEGLIQGLVVVDIRATLADGTGG
jgi:hypothetical protein